MFEISSLSAKYVEFILDNIKHYESYIRNTLEYKEELYENLKKTQNKIVVYNTDSSWFWIRGRKNNKAIDKILESEKISVRRMTLPVDNQEWIKFNYDLMLESTKIKKLLNYA
jgi:glycine/serine hydroxymethyltransferase